MPTPPVFRDSALQRRYDEYGYVTFPLLTAAAVREIAEMYDRLTIEDRYGIGYRVSLYSSSLETRRDARESLIDTAFASLDAYLVDRYPYMATYLVKEPGGRSIPAHQDWSHCDELKHDSMMCWIPLCAADAVNGGLGFIRGSHRFFEYLRAFPYIVANTPVDVHGPRLVPYLDMLHMNAGDVVVFNSRVIHGSLPNTTSAPRVACSFALHPKGEPLLAYYLKPGTGAKVLLEYQATPQFYLEYPNPRLGELYQAGEVVPGYASREVPHDVPTVAWNELEAMLEASGNRADAQRAAPLAGRA